MTSTVPLHSARVHWAPLLITLALAGVLGLSVHVWMLQGLGIPSPEDSPPLWARALNLVGTTTALIVFQRLAQPRLGGFWRTVLISGLLLIMLKEGLRGAVMAGVVTTGWAFSLATVLPPPLLGLSMALICATAARWARSPLMIVLAGLVTGALAVVLQPLVGLAVSPVMAALSPLAHPEVYQPPYPWQVLIPAYLTFAEPVAACAIIAALVWPKLGSTTAARLGLFVLIIVLLKGVLIRAFLFAAFMDADYGAGLLSQSQFLLEFMVLALLVGIGWAAFGGRSHQSRIADR